MVGWDREGERPGRQALVWTSLVGVEQHLTQSNENDDTNDRRKEDSREG